MAGFVSDRKSDTGWLIDGMRFDKGKHPHMDAMLKKMWTDSGGQLPSISVESELLALRAWVQALRFVLLPQAYSI